MILQEKIAKAAIALTANDLIDTRRLLEEIELEIIIKAKDSEVVQLAHNLGGVMIDLAYVTKDYELAKKGTSYVLEVVNFLPQELLAVNHFYNIANGYAAMRKCIQQENFAEGMIPHEYLEEKRWYRHALLTASQKVLNSHEVKVLPLLHTNFGNSLDSMGRPVEALEFYDKAIRQNPQKAEALASKASVFIRMAGSAYGHTHLFMSESKYLLDAALSANPEIHLREYIDKYMADVDDFLRAHSHSLKVESSKTETLSEFHTFLREFCFRHQLYLTPSTLVARREHQFFADPLYISRMIAKLDDGQKFDKYISFFNQIKQDYVFARYLLVQSQYRALHVEVIDKEVDFYYPLDYSIHSAYVEMLKTSFRMAADTLDKIAFFIRDYCQVTSVPENQTSFRNIFSPNKNRSQLRDELVPRNNLLLFGLLDLSIDLKEDGYYAFVQKRRNALTHRFLSIHSESLHVGKDRSWPSVMLDQFVDETITTLRILKAAIFYLVLFVDIEEGKLEKESSRPIMPQESVIAEGPLRWRPLRGDLDS